MDLKVMRPIISCIITVVSKNAHATSLRKRIQKYLCKSDMSKIFQSLIIGVSLERILKMQALIGLKKHFST